MLFSAQACIYSAKCCFCTNLFAMCLRQTSKHCQDFFDRFRIFVVPNTDINCEPVLNHYNRLSFGTSFGDSKTVALQTTQIFAHSRCVENLLYKFQFPISPLSTFLICEMKERYILKRLIGVGIIKKEHNHAQKSAIMLVNIINRFRKPRNLT